MPSSQFDGTFPAGQALAALIEQLAVAMDQHQTATEAHQQATEAFWSRTISTWPRAYWRVLIIDSQELFLCGTGDECPEGSRQEAGTRHRLK
jgi:hypothetical protein